MCVYVLSQCRLSIGHGTRENQSEDKRFYNTEAAGNGRIRLSSCPRLPKSDDFAFDFAGVLRLFLFGEEVLCVPQWIFISFEWSAMWKVWPASASDGSTAQVSSSQGHRKPVSSGLCS